MLKLFKKFVKKLSCYHLLFARCVCSSQSKYFLEMFPFLSSNCRKMGNMRIETEILSQCITLLCGYKRKLLFHTENCGNFRLK